MGRTGVLCVLVLASCVGCGGESDAPPSAASATSSSSSGAGGSPTGGGAEIPCPPGERELTDGSCQAPGVATCGDGFVAVADGCAVIEPAEDCGPGTLALPGETRCRPVQTCSGSRWGAVRAGAQYVDASYAGGDSDGTEAKPWTTLAAGIGAATANSDVALAAGQYAGATVTKPVRSVGSCAGEVTIVGSGGSSALWVQSDVAAEGVSFTGDFGVYVLSGSLSLTQVRVHDTDGIAVYVTSGASAVLSGVLVENAVSTAVLALGAELTVRDSVVRDTQTDVDGYFGRGVAAEQDDSGSPSQLLIERSRIERNHDIGVFAFGSQLTVVDSLVRDTFPRAMGGGTGVEGTAYLSAANVSLERTVVERSTVCGVCAYTSDLSLSSVTVRDVSGPDGLGMGIQAFVEVPGFDTPTLSVTASLIERARLAGIALAGVEGEIVDTVVRDIIRAEMLGRGEGIAAVPSPVTADPSHAIIRGVRIDDATEVGLGIVGSYAELDEVYVRDPRALDGHYGAGVVFHVDTFFDTNLTASGTVRRLVVDRASMAGFGVLASDVEATDVLVRDTQPQEVDMAFGDGIVVSSDLIGFEGGAPATLGLDRVTVSDSVRAGVSAFSAELSLSDSLLICNTFQLNVEEIGSPASVEDAGGNACRCGDTTVCKAASTGLTPPPPLDF